MNLRQPVSGFLLAMLLLLSCCDLTGQVASGPDLPVYHLFLKKKKKTVQVFQDDYIGLTTASDTIAFFGNQELGYQIFKIDTNVLLLRRPLVYRDTVLEATSAYRPEAKEYRYGRSSYKINKKWYRRLLTIDSFEYKPVEIAAITSIQYPPDAGNTMGCFPCAILPVYNFFWWKSLKKRVEPENFTIGKWRLESAKFIADTVKVRPAKTFWLERVMNP